MERFGGSPDVGSVELAFAPEKPGKVVERSMPMSLRHSVAFVGLEVLFSADFAVVGVGEDFQDEDAADVVMVPFMSIPAAHSD